MFICRIIDTYKILVVKNEREYCIGWDAEEKFPLNK